MDTLIRGGTVVTMNPKREILRADLHLSNGRIKAIGAKMKKPEGVVRVIDATGKVIVPGLIQAHIHLCQTLFRNRADGLELLDWLKKRIWPYEAAHDERSMKASAELGIAELLLGGTTAILDMGTVHHQDVVFEAARDWGLRYTGGKAMMDAGVGLPKGLREKTQASLDDSLRLAKAWHGQEGGRLQYCFAPRFVLSCSRDLLVEVGKQSRALACPIHTHASENQHECEAVRAQVGMDNIDYFHDVGILGERTALAHAIWLTEEEQGLIAQTQSSVVHCPSSNLKLASGVAKVPELAAKGARWAIGSDGAPCNNNLDAFMEMRLAALLPKPRLGPTAMPAIEVLEMATLGGARALGLQDDVGSLEVGKKADLVLLDLNGLHCSPAGNDLYNQIVHSARSTDVETVLVDGQVLVQKGLLVRGELSQLVAQAETEARRVTRV
jgi:cytosine/adenosine deaminase-related metal-dependent hydrolase